MQIEGRLPYARVRALMIRADVRVTPHYATGAWSSTIPNKLFDYMLAGLSIVDARPTARIVRAEACGGVFRDRDVQDLARSPLALGNQAERREMGRRGREVVQHASTGASMRSACSTWWRRRPT